MNASHVFGASFSKSSAMKQYSPEVILTLVILNTPFWLITSIFAIIMNDNRENRNCYGDNRAPRHAHDRDDDMRCQDHIQDFPPDSF